MLLFQEKALDIFPDPMKADEAEPIIKNWIKEAADYIKETTGYQDSEDPRKALRWQILADLTDMSWVYMESNPEDDTDDTDFIGISTLAAQLDFIVKMTIADIEEDQANRQRYFINSEGDLFTLDTLRYEYDSFMEMLESDDSYMGMTFEDWIDEWFLSGFDTKEITEEEYNKLKH